MSRMLVRDTRRRMGRMIDASSHSSIPVRDAIPPPLHVMSLGLLAQPGYMRGSSMTGDTTFELIVIIMDNNDVIYSIVEIRHSARESRGFISARYLGV